MQISPYSPNLSFTFTNDVSDREFLPIWKSMLIAASQSRQSGQSPKNICKVILPNNQCQITLKTDQEIQHHFKQYGSWDTNCRKMPLRDLVNITRILLLNDPLVDEQEKKLLIGSLDSFKSKAESKYKNGLKGLVRRVIAVFLNLFLTDSVCLFSMNNIDISVQTKKNEQKNKLPLWVGDSASFVQLVISNLNKD